MLTEKKNSQNKILVQIIKACLITKKLIRATVWTQNNLRTGDNNLSFGRDDALTEFVRVCNQHTSSNIFCCLISISLHNNHFSMFFIIFRQIFIIVHEHDTIQYILRCMVHYYGLSMTELRKSEYQLDKNIEIENKVNDLKNLYATVCHSKFFSKFPHFL